jgi:hypothetical protein
MKMITNSQEQAPSLTDLEMDLSKCGDPVVFLRAFLHMSRRRDRGRLAFDHNALEWIAKAWGAAAAAAIGRTRLRDACLHEQARYAKLCHDLKQGEFERQDSGFVFLCHADDWPPPVVIRGAIDVLTYAGINAVVH